MENNVTFLVLKKELTDIFRDKKTIILGILIPLILFPVIFGVMGKSISKNSDSVTNNLKIAIVDNSNSTLGEFIKSQKSVKVLSSKDVQADVKNGKIFAAIEIPDNFNSELDNEKASEVKIFYDNSSTQSSMARSMVNSFIESYSKEIVAKRLVKRNIDSSFLNPISVTQKTTSNESEGFGKIMLSMLLPLMLVVYSVTGAMAPATDLGAGEKERGTLEPLLTTQANRLSILWGKFLAITVIGLLSTTCAIIGIYISMMQKDGLFKGVSGSSIGISTKGILLIGLVAVLTTMALGALELAISIYARSFKEAQTYMSPLMMIVFIPAYSTYMLDAKSIDTYYFSIPIANVMCLMKEIISGIYNYQHMAITFSWSIIYIVGAILLAKFMFNREQVIFRT